MREHWWAAWLHPQTLLSLSLGLLQNLVLSLPYPSMMSNTKQQLLPLA